jgi:hypothetical protein
VEALDVEVVMDNSPTALRRDLLVVVAVHIYQFRCLTINLNWRIVTKIVANYKLDSNSQAALEAVALSSSLATFLGRPLGLPAGAMMTSQSTETIRSCRCTRDKY